MRVNPGSNLQNPMKRPILIPICPHSHQYSKQRAQTLKQKTFFLAYLLSYKQTYKAKNNDFLIEQKFIYLII